MDIELVHPVAVQDAEPWLRALVTTLLGNPYGDTAAARLRRWSETWDAGRTWAARERGRIVATLATETRTLTVPGPGAGTNDLEVDAVTGVTVSATHRRRGLLTTMITESMQAAHERGDAASVLIAAEWPIYGRFGYAPATWVTRYRYHPRTSRVAGDVARVRQVEPDEVGEVAPMLYDAARRLRPGQVDRRTPWWAHTVGLDGHEPRRGERPNWFVHDGADGIDGLLAWSVTRDFDLNGPMGRLAVPEFVAATDDAYRDLWAYLGGIDVVDEIDLDDRPVDEPVRWLLPDARALKVTDHVDHLWLRLLDVPAALAARSYARPGRVVLDVHDDAPGRWAAGRFALQVAEDGTATCTRSGDAADLRLDQRTLASSYLGGTRMCEHVAAGGVAELTAGALEHADVMFSTPLAPWTQTGF